MNPTQPFNNPFSGSVTPEERAYEMGRRDGAMMSPAPPGFVDNLREIVSYGDFVVRKVNNGYLLREVPHEGGMINSWVVEGGLTEVAKQLTAIQATREIEKANMPLNQYAASYPQVTTSAGAGLAGVVIRK